MARPKTKDSTKVFADLGKHPKVLKQWRYFCKRCPWLTTETARIAFLLENQKVIL